MKLAKLLALYLTSFVLIFAWAKSETYSDEEVEYGPYMEVLDDDRDCSLDIFYNYNDKAIAGVEVTAYKIADISVKGGSIQLELIDDIILGLDESIYNLDYKELLELANKIDYKSFDNNIYRSTITADKTGHVKFDNLEKGLYLLVQTEASGIASNYYKFDNFILSVPFGNEDGSWIYEVECYPKTTTNLLPTPTPYIPQTGDTGKELNYKTYANICMLLGLSLLIMSIFIINITRKETYDREF